MQIVSYENRLAHFCSLRILILSLQKHCVAACVHLPLGGLPEQAIDWLGKQPNVALHDDVDIDGKGWNVKISILQKFLSKLKGRVTWMDADIVVQSDPSRLVSSLNASDLLVCEEAYRRIGRGSEIRTRGLGLPMGRELGFTANSCVVSVTDQHAGLLAEWAELASSPEYLEQQTRPTHERSLHFMGDQDLLTALVGSREYAHVPLKRVESGTDIAHSMLASDFPFGQRLKTLFRGEPPLAHAQGLKVWLHGDDDKNRSMAVQQSTYRLAAKPYATQLDATNRAWLVDIDTLLTRIQTRLFPKRPSLAGLPLGLAGSVRIALSKIKKTALGSFSPTSGPVSHGSGPATK